MFLTLLKAALNLTPLFLFGSTGETLTEKSGHLNMGVPGVMCMGAAGGMIGVHIYDLMIGGNIANCNGFLAFLMCFIFAVLIGALSGLIFSFFTVSLRSNQNVMGLTFTTFGIGCYALIFAILNHEIEFYANYCKKFYVLFDSEAIINNPLGNLFLNHGALWFISFAIAIAVAIFLKKSRVGLSLRAVGENAASADAAGISVGKYRYLATIIGCAIASLGGLYYFVEMKIGLMEFNELDGFGWLAVALVIFTLWRTDLGILGAFLFAFMYKLPNVYTLSNAALNILFQYLPYFVTILILVVLSIFDKKGSKAPGDLGISYFREDR